MDAQLILQRYKSSIVPGDSLACHDIHHSQIDGVTPCGHRTDGGSPFNIQSYLEPLQLAGHMRTDVQRVGSKYADYGVFTAHGQSEYMGTLPVLQARFTLPKCVPMDALGLWRDSASCLRGSGWPNRIQNSGFVPRLEFCLFLVARFLSRFIDCVKFWPLRLG